VAGCRGQKSMDWLGEKGLRKFCTDFLTHT
jgi:hypothetical protein